MPSQFAFANKNVNLVEKCGINGVSLLAQAVKIHPEYEFDARVIYPRNRPPMCGIAVNVSTAIRVAVTAYDLIQQGVDVMGRYVFQRISPDNPIWDPDFHSRPLGQVIQIENDRLFLTDYLAQAEVSARTCYLEPRLENIDLCIQTLAPHRYEFITFELRKQVFERTGAEGRRRVLAQLRAHLLELQPITVADGLTMTVGDFTTLKSGIGPGFCRVLSRPDFVFDPAGNKTKRWHNTGLREYGPFDSEFFTKKNPRVVVITPKEHKGDVEVFIRKFNGGIPKSRIFAEGFVRKYHLHDCQFDFIPFDVTSQPAIAYHEACIEALRRSPRYDLAFVVIREGYASLPTMADPYLITKSTLMAQGLPVQEVEIETIHDERSLPYSLDNMGLACYAKLGGIPWTIISAPGMANELVIGIGSAEIRESRFSSRRKFVGITTVFQADGKFLLANSTKEVDYEDYPSALLESLQTALSYIGRRNAWEKGETVRLIFHVFKPLKNLEVRVIKQFAQNLKDYQIEFAFLHLSNFHPWLLIDPSSSGLTEHYNPDSRLRGLLKGKFVPQTGHYVALGKYEALLTMTGPRELKTPLQGCPSPLLIKLHRESTFGDLDYLTHQVYKFRFLSWRSFQLVSLPVTIAYSDRIAELLGRLRQIPNWNPDILRTELRTSRWFL